MYFSYKFCDKNFLRESFFQIIGIKHIKHNINRGLITSMCSAIFWIFVCVEHMVVWYVTKFAFILTVPEKEDGEPNQKWIKERCFQFFFYRNCQNKIVMSSYADYLFISPLAYILGKITWTPIATIFKKYIVVFFK
jgi:hypothetical protein